MKKKKRKKHNYDFINTMINFAILILSIVGLIIACVQ